MKPGKTILEPSPTRGFPAIVHVGDDDRAVRVKFGALTIYLSNRADPAVVIVRGEGYDAMNRPAPVEISAAADVRGQLEFRVAGNEANDNEQASA